MSITSKPTIKISKEKSVDFVKKWIEKNIQNKTKLSDPEINGGKTIEVKGTERKRNRK